MTTENGKTERRNRINKAVAQLEKAIKKCRCAGLGAGTTHDVATLIIDGKINTLPFFIEDWANGKDPRLDINGRIIEEPKIITLEPVPSKGGSKPLQKADTRKCTDHKDAYEHEMTDGCMECMPWWDTYPVCPTHKTKLVPCQTTNEKAYCRKCKKHYDTKGVI